MLWDPGTTEDGEEDTNPQLIPSQSITHTNITPVPLLVPDVQGLKEQFQAQQNIITNIKETIRQNESQLVNKGKQIEAAAAKLSQIKARSKGNRARTGTASSSSGMGGKGLMKRSSKENIQVAVDAEDKKQPPVKMSRTTELKKRLEENKIKFSERADREHTEVKKIEGLVEQLKTQLQERDVTINELQRSIRQPSATAATPPQRVARRHKDQVTSKYTQTSTTQQLSEMLNLQNKVVELQEALQEKEKVIAARTQAVTLLSEDLSRKGRNTLDSLEETRTEMRAMQANFVTIEGQLKQELLQNDARLTETCDKLLVLEATNLELNTRNAELQQSLDALRSSDCQQQQQQQQSTGNTSEEEEEVAKLKKELDESNKLMIKIKLEHKNKLKALNRTVDTLKKGSDDKTEIARLTQKVEELDTVRMDLVNKVAVLEEEKGNLLLNQLDADDTKESEKKLLARIAELQIRVAEQSNDLDAHVRVISSLESDKLDMLESHRQQSLYISSLNARLEEFQSAKVKKEELEELRISSELTSVQTEEQIEMLLLEKQQLLEKLQSLSGVSSTDSLTFEKMDIAELQGDKETTPTPETLGTEDVDVKLRHLEVLTRAQHSEITRLEGMIAEERDRSTEYSVRVEQLEAMIRGMEEENKRLEQDVEKVETNKTGSDLRNRLKKMQNELGEKEALTREQSERIEELNAKLEDKEKLVRDYIEKIELFEKDDWGRENDWKISQDEFESFQELQKKCLSLENNLIELNEDCERLRKENIEIVHLLSEEKVKRKKLQDEVDGGGGETVLRVLDPLMEESVEVLSMCDGADGLEARIEKLEVLNQELELRTAELLKMIVLLEGRITGLENRDELVQFLTDKLEYCKIVITGKETEIFQLQSKMEDGCRVREELERSLREAADRLQHLGVELKTKNQELSSISANIDDLKDSVDLANQRTVTNEAQLHELLSTVRQMEADVSRKEEELQDMKGILAEKNLDMTYLRTRLEEVNSDLTYSYQEHLENMGKCLRDKEEEFTALEVEKTRVEEQYQLCLIEKEDLTNQQVELQRTNQDMDNRLRELTASNQAMNERMAELERSKEEMENRAKNNVEGKSQETDTLKQKMKILAANLKKKTQNEKELVQRLKELEEGWTEFEELKKTNAAIEEKWTVEKSEKEALVKDLSAVVQDKEIAVLRLVEMENAKEHLEQALRTMEKESLQRSEKYEYKLQQMETQLHKMNEAAERSRLTNEQHSSTVAQLEDKLQEEEKVKERLEDKLQEEEKVKERLEAASKNWCREKEDLQQLITELTARNDDMRHERNTMEARLSDLASSLDGERTKLQGEVRASLTVSERLQAELSEAQRQLHQMSEVMSSDEARTNAVKAAVEAKLQECLAVIDKLEQDLQDTQTQLRNKEAKLVELDESRWAVGRQVEELTTKLMDTTRACEEAETRADKLHETAKSSENKARILAEENMLLRQSIQTLEDAKEQYDVQIKAANEKALKYSSEISVLRQQELDRTKNTELLEEEFHKMAADNKQKNAEIEKLRNENQLLETDLKENMDNLEVVEQSHRHKVEEILAEIATLNVKCAEISKEKAMLEEKLKDDDEGDEKRRKKRKSVTFRTDELDYITELKKETENYRASLKQTNEELETLKMELFNEKLRNQVCEVVTEDQVKAEILKSSPGNVPEKKIEEPRQETTFDAKVFFGSEQQQFVGNQFFQQPLEGFSDQTQQPNETTEPLTVDYDSLMWDDGWGTDGHLEDQYLSQKVSECTATPHQEKTDTEKKCERLESELKDVQSEKESILEELRVAQVKYSKIVKKLKEQKAVCDKLQASKKSESFGDLDAAIMDEMKVQIAELENKGKELVKDLETSKLEKENLLKRMEVLNTVNDRFQEMKEDAKQWQEEKRKMELELTVFREELETPVIVGDSDLGRLNKDLRNQVEGLEWKVCELTELLEEKEEMLAAWRKPENQNKSEVTSLEQEIEQLNSVKESLELRLTEKEKDNELVVLELEEKLEALATENEELLNMVRELKQPQKDQQPMNLGNYFQQTSPQDFFSAFQERSTEAVSTLPVETNWKERYDEVKADLEALASETTTTEKGLLENYEEVHRNSLQLQEQLEKCQFQLELEIEKNTRMNEEFANATAYVNEKEMECSVVRDEVVQRDERITTLESQLEELRKNYSDSKSEIERLLNEEALDEQAKVIDSFQDNELVSTEIETLRKSLNDQHLRNAQLEAAVLDHERMLEASKTELANTKQRLIAMEKELEEKEIQKTELTVELDKWRNNAEEWIKEVERLGGEYTKRTKETEELKKSHEEKVGHLKSQMNVLETELIEVTERKEFDIGKLRFELEEMEKRLDKESVLNKESVLMRESELNRESELDGLRERLEVQTKELSTVRSQLGDREGEIAHLEEELEEAALQVRDLTKTLKEVRFILDGKEAEVSDLRQTMQELHSEMSQFRDWDKQMKAFEMSQQHKVEKALINVPKDADDSEEAEESAIEMTWAENEVREVATRLQSDLDTALYMLHLRDVRCDELTFELMELLKERDMLQLRLSTSIRINEELKKNGGGQDSHLLESSTGVGVIENAGAPFSPRTHQPDSTAQAPSENLQQLAQKLSELHHVGYMRDKTVQDESVQRHRDQMTLLGRISDSDVTLSRDVQSPPAVLLNWIRGKSTPKVMHI